MKVPIWFYPYGTVIITNNPLTLKNLSMALSLRVIEVTLFWDKTHRTIFHKL